MRRFFLTLLLIPATLGASCLDHADPLYNIAVSRGQYDEAFHIVAGELRLTPEEKQRFKIIEGFSRTHDDRNGQADPETMALRLDPGLFIEGKEGACQGIIHELTHWRQFQRDRRRLHAFFSAHAAPKEGWKGCDRETLRTPNAQEAEEEAYDCLQDNDLVPHAAADDIEAVLAQLPYAAQRTLRDDDRNYLLENLRRWADHASVVRDPSNESYYLSEIKREDIQIFCRGTDYARQTKANPKPFQHAWDYFCRNTPGAATPRGRS